MKYFIYTLSDPRTNEIRYVGKTKQPKDRMSRHLQKCYLDKYDKNTYKSNWIKALLKENVQPKMYIIEEGDNIDINEKEIFWIKWFKDNGYRLTNLSEGGEIGVDWTGRKHKKSSIEKMIENNHTRKEVIQYDLNGEILNEYFSLSEASRESGCHIFLISNCCKKKKYYTVNGTTFRYKDDDFDYYEYNKNKQVNSKPIVKYTIEGNFIKEFDSQRSAAVEMNTNHGNIKRCCEVKYKKDTHGRKTNKPITVKGFTYRYKGDNF